MKTFSYVVVVAALSASSLVVTVDRVAAAAACPAGYIRCSEWCQKYRPHLAPSNFYSCYRGATTNCVKTYGGLSACINDRPPRSRGF
jgi:hypothetical protein